MEQLSFIDQVTVKEAAPPKPITMWDRLAAGLAANEMQPVTREDVRRARDNQRK